MGRIKLYKNHTNKNVWNKNFDSDDSGWINITFKDTVDVLNPIVNLTFDESYLDYNYMFIEEFDRYYFIEKTELESQIFTCYCHVDVLETYKNSIKKCQAIADRNGFQYNFYLPDKEFPIENYEIIQIKESNKKFTKNYHFVLSTLGG